MPVTFDPTKSDAAKAAARLASDPWTMSDIGPHMTCYELEALAVMLAAGGAAEAAVALLCSHVGVDEEGDLHIDADAVCRRLAILGFSGHEDTVAHLDSSEAWP